MGTLLRGIGSFVRVWVVASICSTGRRLLDIGGRKVGLVDIWCKSCVGVLVVLVVGGVVVQLVKGGVFLGFRVGFLGLALLFQLGEP
jgi:hypothetical protein